MVIKIHSARRQQHFYLIVFSHRQSSGSCHRSIVCCSIVTLQAVAIIAIIVNTHTTSMTKKMSVRSQSSLFRCQSIFVVLGFSYYHSLTLPALLPSHSWTHHAFFRTNMGFIHLYMCHFSSSTLLSSSFSIYTEAAKMTYIKLRPLSSLLTAVALLTLAVAVLPLHIQSRQFGLRTLLQRWSAREVSYLRLCEQRMVTGVLLRFVLLDLSPL